MEEFSYKNEFIHKYVSEFTSRIASETGIPSDRHHYGKIIMQCMKNDPDFIMQIDGATGESETNGSVLRRSIQCAISFRNMGLKTGDVIVLMAPLHLDLAVPFYAAMYLGIAAAAIDRTFRVDELRHAFETCKPKIIFCQSEKVEDVRNAVALVGLDTKIITFDESPDTTFSEMMENHGGQSDVENFKPADFDPEETTAILLTTSGTTGPPKITALTHKNIVAIGPFTWAFANKVPITRSVFLVAPLQWVTTVVCYALSALYKYTRIQSSNAIINMEHILELIGKCKPTLMISSPTMMTTLVKMAKNENCDFSCFEVLYIGGNAVPTNLLKKLKSMAPKAIVAATYGFTEIGTIVFYSGNSPAGSCGKPIANFELKLVNIETGEEIKEPNKPGELWAKVPGGFKGYLNNPEATAETLSKDGFFKSGDLMYRDENWNFYFTERMKIMMKYMGYQMSPVELETVIRQHPGVLDVAVTSLPDIKCGDLPVACVIPVPGAEVTAEEIKNLIKEKLSDKKQLRGGVFFLKELPLTSSTKLHRRKLKEIVIAMAREKVQI